VPGFDAAVWENVKYYLLAIGLYAKFSQNSNWKRQLLHTNDKHIVVVKADDTATKKGRDWSSGSSLDKLPSFKVGAWPEKNMLGEGLMAVRECFGMKVENVMETIKRGTAPTTQREAMTYAVHYWLRPHNYIGLKLFIA